VAARLTAEPWNRGTVEGGSRMATVCRFTARFAGCRHTHCINHVSLCQSLLSNFLPRLPYTNQEYHILEHNCLTFTRAACKHLGRGHRVGNVKRSRLELHLRQFHDCRRFLCKALSSQIGCVPSSFAVWGWLAV